MTLTFRPDHYKYAGRSRYFTLKIKEKNSVDESLTNVFNCVVNVGGELWHPDDDIEWKDVMFKIGKLGSDSKGSIMFKEPMNLTFVADHLTEIFDFYVKNNTFRDHNETVSIIDIVVDNISPDGKLLNYTAEFKDPYLLGLLKKIPDKFFIHFKGG